MSVLSRLCSGLLPHTPQGGALYTKVLQHARRGFKHKRNKKVTEVAEQTVKEATEVQATQFEIPNINNLRRSLVKCTVFAGGFCTVAFAGTSIWEYEKLRSNRQEPLLLWAKSRWNDMEGWQNKEGEFRQFLNRWWNDLPDGHRIFWPICFLNLLVFACWHHPILKVSMMRYFAFSPAAHAVCWPMILSAFSHSSILHLGVNMYVLHSFSPPICNKLGQEQFLALYLSAGVLSSLCGALFKVATSTLNPSLGASGAIMGMIGYFCYKYPDAKLGVVFIPNFHFSAQQGILALMCLDTAGILFRWRIFDHASHLGGALTGIAYSVYGDKLWEKRRLFLQSWHNFREELENERKKR